MDRLLRPTVGPGVDPTLDLVEVSGEVHPTKPEGVLYRPLKVLNRRTGTFGPPSSIVRILDRSLQCAVRPTRHRVRILEP